MAPAVKKRRAKPKQAPTHNDSPLMSYLIIFGLCGYMLLAFITKLYLENRSNALAIEVRQEQDHYQQVLKIRNNLKLERERHTTAAYILPRAGQLGLEPTRGGQVRTMSPIMDCVIEPSTNVVETTP